MIYSKVENPKCGLCTHSDSNKTSGNILCDIKGTVPADFCCKKFTYDIFKKKIKPRQNRNVKEYSTEDFSL